jgi:electron transfer flavoprotein beta subunit
MFIYIVHEGGESMKILVLLKQTFDTEESIVVEDGQISEDGVNFIINPYDEYAVEEAIKLKEDHGGEVTIISVGPSRTEEALRTAFAMGADRAILVDDERAFGDELTIAEVLTTIIKQKEYDIILGGYMAVDDGSAQVGPRVAEALGIPHVSTIVNLSVDGDRANIERDVEGNLEIIEVDLPVLVTAQQGLNEPRYPSLPAIMKAKRKPIERLSIDDLGLSIEDLKPKTKLVNHYLPPKKEAGRILKGELEQQVKELTQLLRNEAKVV